MDKVLPQVQQEVRKKDGKLNDRKRLKLLGCKALFSHFAIVIGALFCGSHFLKATTFFPGELGFSPDSFPAEQIIKFLGSGHPWEALHTRKDQTEISA